MNDGDLTFLELGEGTVVTNAANNNQSLLGVNGTDGSDLYLRAGVRVVDCRGTGTPFFLGDGCKLFVCGGEIARCSNTAGTLLSHNVCGTLNMNFDDASIHDNVSGGEGVFKNTIPIRVSGATVIRNNRLTDGTIANLYITSGGTFTQTGDLDASAFIGVTGSEAPTEGQVFVTKSAAALTGASCYVHDQPKPKFTGKNARDAKGAPTTQVYWHNRPGAIFYVK